MINQINFSMNNFVRFQIFFGICLIIFTIWFHWLFPNEPKPNYKSYDYQFAIDPNNKPELSEGGFTKEYVLDGYLKGYPIKESDEMFLGAWYGKDFFEIYKPMRDSIIQRRMWSDSVHKVHMKNLEDGYTSRQERLKKVQPKLDTAKKDTLKN